jgi:hypothetical protein
MIKWPNLDSSLQQYIDGLGMGLEQRGAIGGTVYYVEGNYGNDYNDGLSLKKPFKTLAKALAVSHANIGQRERWARRNTIYLIADSTTETLTKLAQKTDIVGLGQCDGISSARITGAHTIDTTSYTGCRFFNVNFRSTAAACDIMTIPTEQSGIGFFRCDFNGQNTAAAHGAIIATAVESLSIVGCRFRGAFDDAVIELGAGATNSLLIEGNIIEGANMGIDVNASLTTALRIGWIKNNYIKSTLACINDASSKLHIVGNRGITLAAKGSDLAGAVVGNTALAADNEFTCSDGTCLWPAQEAI